MIEMSINLLTTLKVLDNSGALEAKCVKSYKKGRSLGHVVPVLITRTRPDSKVKSGKICHGLIV